MTTVIPTNIDLEELAERSVMVSMIDTSEQLPLIGERAQKLGKRLVRFLKVHKAVDLLGPPGTGKSHLGMWIVIEIARMLGRPAFFVQGDPGTTKSNTIGGLRMLTGGVVLPVKSVLGMAMALGAPVFFDEFTHVSPINQEAYTTLLDRVARVYIGGKVLTAKKGFCMVIAHNTAAIAGNSPLIPAIAGRIPGFKMGYPEIEDECQIAIDIAHWDVFDRPYNGKYELVPPIAVAKYLTALAVLFREKNELMPVSPRNVAAALKLMHMDDEDIVHGSDIDQHFLTEPDAKTRAHAERIFFKGPFAKDPSHSSSMVTKGDKISSEVVSFKQYVTSYSLLEFREAVASCFCLHQDIAGIPLSATEKLRKELYALIV